MSFDGKTALVFGASSGIGLQIARLLCDGGAKTYCAARRECPDARVFSIQTDAQVPDEVCRAVHAAASSGRLDYLVYSAGCSMAAPVELFRDDDVRYLFEVNFFGALQAAKTAIPYMKERGGRILFISSLGASLPIAFDSFYSCSKAALDMLAKSLRLELAPYGILASSLRPGGTATDFTFKRKVYSKADSEDYFPRLRRAVNRLAQIEQSGASPEAVAAAAIKILRAAKPPITAAVGLSGKSLALGDKLLPQKLSNYINSNIYFS